MIAQNLVTRAQVSYSVLHIVIDTFWHFFRTLWNVLIVRYIKGPSMDSLVDRGRIQFDLLSTLNYLFCLPYALALILSSFLHL